MFNCGNRDCGTNDKGVCLVKTIPCADYKPKDKLILLVGESGSGKTTIAEELEETGYNYIESYTTRPKRYENERGHIFTDFKEYEIDDRENQIIAYTFFNENHYWARKDQYQGKGTSIYIVDAKGVEDVKKNVDDAEIITIYIKVEYGARYFRMIENRRSYEGTVQRIKHDIEKFKLIKCDYVVDNNGNLKETVEIIKKIIEGDTNVL